MTAAPSPLELAPASFQALIENVKDYAIFMLDARGRILTWNRGAERIKGYRAEEIIGRDFSVFYPRAAVAAGVPASELEKAVADGRFEDEGYRLRKDGTPFWANVSITPIFDARKALLGFVKVTRDLTERKRAEDELRAARDELLSRTAQLEAVNGELEAFVYSVSHDLRAPLRSANGFSQALLEEYGARLDDQGRGHLKRIRAAVQHMGVLIDSLLSLSKLTRKELSIEQVDLGELARNVVASLRESEPQRDVTLVVADGLVARGDRELLSLALENLVANAWKFTSRHERAKIELGSVQQDGSLVYFVRDDGAGFNMAHVDSLFGPFQRLHRESEFPGTGVGLATVQRIVSRHGGRIWAEGQPEKGATFYFTLENAAAGARDARKDKVA